jgi:hypothetical protein
MKEIHIPCSECSFRRDIEPGFLGGSPPEVYIGQSVGPFKVPCHKACDFDDPNWREKSMYDTTQCAGMAIYRTNVGVADRMPADLHKLPADRNTVFATHAEFLAHHRQIPLHMAEAFLKVMTPDELLRYEMAKAEVMVVKKARAT